MTPHLPEHLHDAYAWTAAAGELDELASLTGEALDTYARESAENCREHGDGSVTAWDIAALARWFRSGT